MKRILITGAAGNVGLEVINHLAFSPEVLVLAGVRNPDCLFTSHPVQNVYFDFEDAARSATALQNLDCLFLLRPPQIADVPKYFAPLITEAQKARVKHIVFLSVQGAEKNSFIPHFKIEKLLRESGIPYTFLRPAYFMQNFTTTLLPELQLRHRIFLPAGHARFAVVDVRDIGAVAAKILLAPEHHQNAAYDLTANQNLTFPEMAEKLSAHLGFPVVYQSPNLLSFYLHQQRQGIQPAFILVMMMLHFLPRFQPEPQISHHIKTITGKEPFSFSDFVRDHKALLAGKPVNAEKPARPAYRKS